MLVTAYDAGPESCGWKRKYGCIGPPVYAYGPREGKPKKVGIAADASRCPFGTKMYVPGYGWGVVHDRGSAIKGDHIDIFFEDRDDALEWDRRLDIIIERQ